MVYHEGSRIASLPMSPVQWPDLPHPLRPGHAYGVLEVRAGEITEEDRQDLDAEDLASMPQEGDIRHCLLARVDLRTGELFTEGYLSRDQYDWRIDTIVFRPYRSEREIHPEEGLPHEFAIQGDDLGEVRSAWEAYLAGARAQALDTGLPAATPGHAGPRL